MSNDQPANGHNPHSIGLEGLKLSREQFSKKAFVILNKDKTSVMADLGTSRPWWTYNKKYADSVAKKAHGHAVTFEEAVKILLKTNSQ